MTLPGLCLSATPGSVPLRRRTRLKYCQVTFCFSVRRKSLDLDPAFSPNQGSGLCYGSRYPSCVVCRPLNRTLWGAAYDRLRCLRAAVKSALRLTPGLRRGGDTTVCLRDWFCRLRRSPASACTLLPLCLICPIGPIRLFKFGRRFRTRSAPSANFRFSCLTSFPAKESKKRSLIAERFFLLTSFPAKESKKRSLIVERFFLLTSFWFAKRSKCRK